MPRPLLGQPQPVPMPYGRGGDPYWNSVSLLLRMDGPHGSRTFSDLSKNRFVVTASGDAQVTNANTRYGIGTAIFDGNGDFLSIPSSAEFNFASDFTVEAWLYRTTSSGIRALIDCRSSDVLGAWSFSILTGNTLDFIYQTSAPSRLTTTSTVPLNQWSHVAAARQGGTLRLFIDGVASATASVSGAINANGSPSVGGGRSTVASTVNGYYYTGAMADVRVTRGVARYTSSFAPITAPFPIGYQ